MDNRIDGEKLHQALEQVRRDIANLQSNRSEDSADLIRLVAFILYLVLAEFLHSVLGINILWCILISVLAVTIYAFALVIPRLYERRKRWLYETGLELPEDK